MRRYIISDKVLMGRCIPVQPQLRDSSRGFTNLYTLRQLFVLRPTV